MGSLTSAQHAVLVGSLLGDGTLRKQGTRTNALLEVNHSFKHKEYVDWKWRHFHDVVLTHPRSRIGTGTRVAYRFTTRSLPVFTDYYYWFYKTGRKNVPEDLKLNPVILAVWFMDDGTRSRSAVYLNTQQFSIEEQLLLQRLLKRSFNIDSTLNRDKQYWRLRIRTESTKKLVRIVSPFIVPCFQYKLRYDPVTTDSKDEIRSRQSADGLYATPYSNIQG